MKCLVLILMICTICSCKHNISPITPIFQYTYVDSVHNVFTVSDTFVQVTSKSWNDHSLVGNEATVTTCIYPGVQIITSSDTINRNFLMYVTDCDGADTHTFTLIVPDLNNLGIVAVRGATRNLAQPPNYGVINYGDTAIISTTISKDGGVYNGTFAVSWNNGSSISGSFKNLQKISGLQ